MLTLPSVAEVVCKGVKVKIQGSVLAPLKPIGSLTSEIKLAIHGSSGKQEVTGYENESGEKEYAKVELNSGGGYIENDLNISSEVQLATSAGKTLTVQAFGPGVETKAATGVKETEATLHGTVDPEGLETKYYFEYGTEKDKFTKKTAEASAGSGTSYVEESKTLTGLTVATTYYYRLVATNTEGKTIGGEKSFTTYTKPTVETKAATGRVGTEATLNGVVNPKGATTKYYIEYGLASEKAKYEHKTAELSAGAGRATWK